MTDVARHLADLIRASGPISIAEFMRVCLTVRGDSYYQRGDPFGAAGDFVTAPEISQIFGELIGLWCADVWRQLGAPARCTLAELGPGRGTLMKDVLRVAGIVPGFRDAVSVVFVEVSEPLKRVQRDALGGVAPVVWRDRVEDIDAQSPLIVIANEFFDALPVRQFVRTLDGWAERCVGLGEGDALRFGLAPAANVVVPAPLHGAALGCVFEISPMRAAAASAVGDLVARVGGAVLAIDYGFEGPAVGDTLQALRSHRFVDVLDEPGSADLTTHVDFTALGEAFAGAGLRVASLTGQGAFLNALGAAARVAKLKAGATLEQAAVLDSAYQRLTGDEAMGSLFKVLCAFAPASLQPAGFASS